MATATEITLEEYDAMLEAQGGGCAICGATESGHGRTRNLCVDHDHTTGAVRALLCHGCNGGLGHFKDDPDRMLAAIEYLKRF